MSVECVLRIRGGGGPKGECPVWSVDEQCLYWVDIDGGTLNRFDPATGANDTCAVGEPIGSFAIRSRGGFLIATRSGVYVLDFATGRRRLVCQPEPEHLGNRANDGRCDPAGRFWFGTMPERPDGGAPRGALYQVESDGSCARVLDGLFIPNGLAFASDRRRAYLSDSHPDVRSIWAFDFDPDRGALTNRRVFATTQGLAGRPDGGCCDADGCYWSAHIDGGQIVRYSPDGKVDRAIGLPVKWPTMCAFGGPRLDVLYITSLRRGGAAAEHPDQPLAGSIFACTPGVRGVAEPRFLG